MARLVLVFGFLTTGFACGSDVDSQGVPADWTLVTASCGYSFMAPRDLVAQEGQGIDSCFDGWLMDSCELLGERETIAGPGPVVETEELLDFRQFTEIIDGRAAELTTARHQRFPSMPFFSSVYFAPGDSNPAIAVWAFCSTEAPRDETLLLYRSVRISGAFPQ